MTEESTPPAKSQRIWETPAGVKLSPLADIANPGSHGFVLQIKDRFFHGFIVRKGDQLSGFVDHCPHAGVPMTREVDGYLTEDASHIACNWHGALFRTEDGHCVGGPCVGQKLRIWPVALKDGWIITA